MLEEFLRLVNEASSRAARIQTLVAKINTAHGSTPDDYGATDCSQVWTLRYHTNGCNCIAKIVSNGILVS